MSSLPLVLGLLVFGLTLLAGLVSHKSSSSLAFWSCAGFGLFFVLGLVTERIWRRLSSPERPASQEAPRLIDVQIGPEIPPLEV